MSHDTRDWEQRVAALWASFDDHGEEAFLARMDALVAELPPGSALGAYERASAFDSTGATDRAVPLYREALAGGLDGGRRREAAIQLASSLRTIGEPEESVAILEAERDAASDDLDDAVAAFLALALLDTGREREAVSVAVTALAGHMTRYRRSVEAYARDLAG